MAAGWIVVAGLAILALGSFVWGSWLWLARSWEELDEDQFHAKLSETGSARSSDLWSRMRFWFRPKHRQLTYRRDERGRFRHHRR